MAKGKQGLARLPGPVALMRPGVVTLTSRDQRLPLGEWMRRRARVIRRDGGLCAKCRELGLRGVGTEVDHVVPLAQGGTNDESNLQLLCKPHHAAKSADEAKGRRL